MKKFHVIVHLIVDDECLSINERAAATLDMHFDSEWHKLDSIQVAAETLLGVTMHTIIERKIEEQRKEKIKRDIAHKLSTYSIATHYP